MASLASLPLGNVSIAVLISLLVKQVINDVKNVVKNNVAQVKVLICLPRAVTQMGKDVENLRNAKNEIEVELHREGKRAKPTVMFWLELADMVSVSADSIHQQYAAHQEHKSYLGCCPKCLCRNKISREIIVWNRLLAELHSHRANPNFPSSGQYGVRTLRTQIPLLITETCIVEDAKRSEQREVAERLLTDANSNIQRIGIIGMGGVGKTQLLDTINNSDKVKTSFDLIIKLTVSRNDISALQKCVAERLSLGQLPDYPEGRRDILRNGLKNRRYLLLLDDMWAANMWTRDSLQDLGVSLQDKTCKFVLTTRDEEVCARMNVQHKIVVEPLLEEQGWQLFRSRAFGNEDGNVAQDIKPVARKFSKECKGLPLAINVVAAAVSHHTTLYEWEDALDQMRSGSEAFNNVHVGVDEQLFKRLKWSYDVLPHHLKTCFLYFAAYPEDTVVYCEQVIDMWISLGLVIGEGDSNLHDFGYKCIEHLAGRCLIEEAGKDSVGRIFSVKIHDMLRDMAIRIAEERCHFKAGVGVRHFPSEKDLEGCERMSLMRNDLHSLPTTFACSSLTVLLLRENPGITEVPESFLSQLPSLRVLDLSQTGIRSLPPSIGNLKYLACLNLSECSYICELPEAIGDLKELQFLNVSFCGQLKWLPQRISELNSLRALDIRGCRRLSHLPRGISEVVSLERLRMLGSTIRLGFEEEADAERQYACLKDLQTLSRLRVFSAEVKSPFTEGVMEKWSNMRDLSLRFEDANGEDHLPHDMQAMEDLESLSLWYFGVERLPSWVTQFRKLACLCLVGCKQLKELPAELPSLRVLWLDKCDKLKELQLGMRFPKLQEMTLRNLESLECVTMETVVAASGSGGLREEDEEDGPMLNFLEVWECSKLKTLRGRWDELKCLHGIRGQTEWWDAIQWEDPNMEELLEDKFIVYSF